MLATTCRPLTVQSSFVGSNPAVKSLRSIRMVTQRRTAPTPVKAAATNNDVQGDMLVPSVANKPLVRLVALAATIAAAAKSTEFLPAAGLGFLHILSYSTWMGTLAWTTFVFGIVAFKNLPRQTFGKLQAKLFPKYFALSTVAPAICLATLHYATGGAIPQKQLYLLAASSVSSFINMFFTEPAATKVMLERYEMENQPAALRDDATIAKMKKTFGKFHGISSLLNLIAVIGAIGHGYYLGGQLSF